MTAAVVFLFVATIQACYCAKNMPRSLPLLTTGRVRASTRGGLNKLVQSNFRSAEFQASILGNGEGKSGRLSIPNYTMYHSSQKLDELTRRLGEKGSCKVPIHVEDLHDPDGTSQSLLVAYVGSPKATKRILVVANEHAREMLGAEVAVQFLHLACGTEMVPAGMGDETSHANSLLAQLDLSSTLDAIQYVVIPNMNKGGRALVESQAKPCQRYTAKGIDLNRNMDVDFQPNDKHHGAKPFSSAETRILRDLADKLQPLAFVDLHTGAYSLMTSWGTKKGVTPDFDDQQKVLDVIKQEHCKDCEIGPNSLVIGYENPGEIMDHMYEKAGVKYSFLWELYVPDHETDEENCVAYFNPNDSDYLNSVNNWAGALFTCGIYLREKAAPNERSSPGFRKFHHSAFSMLDSRRTEVQVTNSEVLYSSPRASTRNQRNFLTT